MPDKMAAIVLAGSRGPGDPVAEHLGINDKCLADIAGTPMVARVVRALRTHPAIDEIVVVSNDPQKFATILKEFDGIRHVAAAPGPSQSVSRALAELDGGWPVLLTTGDHALLSEGIIDEFLRGSAGDMAVGLVRDQQIEAVAPGNRRTYFRFSDGRFSGANLFYLGSVKVAPVLDFWREVEAKRKKPWILILKFGLPSLFSYLVGRLSLAAAMRRVSKVLGLSVQAVQLSDGRAAIDVDKPGDLAMVRDLISRDSGPR